MHDLWRGGDKRSRGQDLLLVVDQDCESALEDVERIQMLPVEVRLRAGAGVQEQRLGDAELVEVGLDHDPSVEERLALAGPVHDACHPRRL